MKKIVLFVIIAISTTAVNSQELIKRISSDAEVVFELGMDKLNAIYPYKKVFKNEMWKDLAKHGDMKSMLETGIDFGKPGYFSVDITDSCTYYSLHFYLTSKTKFQNLLTKQSLDFDVFENYKGTEYTYVRVRRDGNMFLTNSTATMSFATMNSEYRNNNLESLLARYYEEVANLEYEYQQKNQIEGIFGREYMLHLLKGNRTSFETSKCYQIVDEKEEVNIYVNKVFSQLSKVMGGREIRQFSNVFSAFDGYQSYRIAANPGALDVNIELNFDENISGDILKLTAGKTLNKEFLKYIPTEGMAMYMMSLNPKAYYEWLKKTLSSAIGGQYMSSESGKDIIDIIGMLIDEESIVKLVSGDVLFSFNEMKKELIEFKKSSYDDNFERVETIVKEEVEYPEFTVVIGVENKEFFQKIINILKRENLVKEEEGYLFIPGNRELRSGLGIRLDNDKLIISNDFKLFKKIQKKELYAPRTLDENLSFYGEVKLDQIFDNALKSVRNYGDYTFFNSMQKTFKNLEFKSSSVENGFGITGKIVFKDQKKNAYKSLLDMVNDLYLADELNGKQGRYDFYSERLRAQITRYEALTSDKKTPQMDERVKNAKAALKSKEAKEDSFILDKYGREISDFIQYGDAGLWGDVDSVDDVDEAVEEGAE